MDSATDEDLETALLRFRPVHPTPLPNKLWRWTLALTTGTNQELKEAFADLAAEGGTERVLVRRPRRGQGPLARQVEAKVFPDRVAEREAKGKGKKGGKGKGKGGGKKGAGKVNGDGGVAKAGGSAPAAASTGPVLPGEGAGMAVGAAMADGKEGMRGSYTGRDVSPPAASRARRG